MSGGQRRARGREEGCGASWLLDSGSRLLLLQLLGLLELLELLVFSVNSQNHKALAYGIFRFALGIVEFMHGLVRLPGLAGFATGMVKQFQGTIMPDWFVYSFGSVLPFLEGLIGLALIFGVFTQWALVAASLLMSILIFGTSLRSDWAIVGLQMTYVVAFFIALFLLEHNRYSIDRVIHGKEE